MISEREFGRGPGQLFDGRNLVAHLDEFEGDPRRTLLDIVDTPPGPELLPTNAAGEMVQVTESTVGPYELVDFFLYHFLRFGATPEKILFLAEHAPFSKPHTPAELREWLRVFLRPIKQNPATVTIQLRMPILLSPTPKIIWPTSFIPAV